MGFEKQQTLNTIWTFSLKPIQNLYPKLGYEDFKFRQNLFFSESEVVCLRIRIKKLIQYVDSDIEHLPEIYESFQVHFVRVQGSTGEFQLEFYQEDLLETFLESDTVFTSENLTLRANLMTDRDLGI